MPDGTSMKFVENLQKDLESLQGVDAKIASGGGRMHVTMDRYEVLLASFCFLASPYHAVNSICAHPNPASHSTCSSLTGHRAKVSSRGRSQVAII